MSLVVEHLRPDVKGHPDNRRLDPVEHEWSADVLDALSCAVEEDGGPALVDALYARREANVEHVFSRDYEVAGVMVRRGDVVRAWRERRGHG